MLGLIFAGAQLALGIGSTLLNHSAQNKAASESERAAAAQKQAVTNAANKSAVVENQQLDMRLQENQLGFDQTIAALAARRDEERIASRRSILSVDRAGRMADAQGRLSAGASGVAGASVDAVLSDVGMQASDARKSVIDNFTSTSRQLDRQDHATRDTFFFTQRATEAERAGIEANRLNRIAGVQNIATAPHANPFATALQLGGAALSFASQYKAATTPPPTKLNGTTEG